MAFRGLRAESVVCGVFLGDGGGMDEGRMEPGYIGVWRRREEK